MLFILDCLCCVFLSPNFLLLPGLILTVLYVKSYILSESLFWQKLYSVIDSVMSETVFWWKQVFLGNYSQQLHYVKKWWLCLCFRRRLRWGRRRRSPRRTSALRISTGWGLMMHDCGQCGRLVCEGSRCTIVVSVVDWSVRAHDAWLWSVW